MEEKNWIVSHKALGKAIYGEDIAKLKGSMRRLHFGNVPPYHIILGALF